MDTPFVVDTPDDPEFLTQFARASMLHAHLDNTLKMFVRSFEGRTIEGVLGYIGYQGAARLRARVAKLARDKLDDVRASQTGRRSDRFRP
jgi:hypothetical protein